MLKVTKQLFVYFFMIKKLLGLLTWVVAFNISAHELKTIDEIHSAYKNNTITAQQLTQGYIKRINQLNPQFNAVINLSLIHI